MDLILNNVSPLWGICRFEDLKENLLECRAKQRIPEGAETVFVFAFPYLLPEEKYKNLNISKYAVPADYHITVSAKLDSAAEMLREKYPGEKFEAFADNSPIPEVEAGCLSGMGVKGMNSLLITEKYGSYVFLGEIVSTLKINCEEPLHGTCMNCGLCSESCPAGALENGKINKDKCLSGITQKKGELSPDEEKLIKESGCVWGCDICQNVCPMNKKAQTTDIEEFIATARADITEVTDSSDRAYDWRGKKVLERNIGLLKKRD